MKKKVSHAHAFAWTIWEFSWFVTKVGGLTAMVLVYMAIRDFEAMRQLVLNGSVAEITDSLQMIMISCALLVFVARVLTIRYGRPVEEPVSTQGKLDRDKRSPTA